MVIRWQFLDSQNLELQNLAASHLIANPMTAKESANYLFLDAKYIIMHSQTNWSDNPLEVFELLS